jgi:SAM-dependent methyltransferase
MKIRSFARIRYQACPLCDGRESSLHKEGDCSNHPLYTPAIPKQIFWLRCQACGHVFTDGYFGQDACAVIFQKTNPEQQPSYAFEQYRAISARMVDKVARYQSAGRWLDVGFGNGSLLFTASEWGFLPVGLDLRPSSVEVMTQLGFECHCQDISTFQVGQPHAVISMADVLEHMPFPIEGLKAAHRLLQPEGILFLSMPAFGSPTWRFLDVQNANPYWGELEHYHNFSRERLYDLLGSSGFKAIHYGISERYRVCMEVIARRI